MHRLTLMLALLVLLLGSAAAAPPPLDRRSRDEPEVVIEAGGRSGPADVVTYTPDGRYILVAGDDKVVRQWTVRNDGVDTLSDNLHTLRWPGWREQRGGIKCLALSSDGKKVALGGFGLRNSTVAILDRDSGEQLALTWPVSRKGQDSFNVVTAIVFHPDNQQVAFGTADGSLFLWKPEKLTTPDDEGRRFSPPGRIGRHDRLPANLGSEEFNVPRLLWFADKNSLLSIAQSGQVLQCDVSSEAKPVIRGDAPQARSLFNVYDGQKTRYKVYRAALAGGGKTIVVAASGPQVLLRSVDGQSTTVLDLAEDTYARSLAVTANADRLAIGLARAESPRGQPRFYVDTDDVIQVYQQPRKGAQKPVLMQHAGPAEAMAWHPEKPLLAVAGGDAHELSIYNVDKPNLAPFATHGAGRKIWQVALSESGKQFGFRTQRDVESRNVNARGKGNWVAFDLPKLNTAKAAPKRWLEPQLEGDGWKVVPDEGSRFTWHIERRGVRHRLPWDQDRDQAPTCYAFLPSLEGSPTRLLVGHYYGASLFEITKTGPVRTRVFTGHHGEVLSLAVAADQTWFLSGGSDETLCAFNLKEWPHQPELGVAFEEGQNGPVVKAVAVGSPAWEAGLTVGDTIVQLAVDGKLVFSMNPKNPVGTPAVARQALDAPRPSVELHFLFQPKAGGDFQQNLTTLKQRPLWKFFPAFDDLGRMDDWVIWMWKGSYYFTRSTNGDRLVGWHVNHPELDGTPEFFKLNQFRQQFENEGVILELVNTRSVEAALKVALGENPQRPQFAKYEPAPVHIALQNSVVARQGVQFNLQVNQRGTNVDLLPDYVEVWLNDHRLQVLRPQGKKLTQQIAVAPNLFRHGENKISVLTFNPLGGRAERQVVIENPGGEAEPQLLGLAVGINNFAEHRKSLDGSRVGFADLQYAVNDATQFRQTMEGYRGEGKFYRGSGLTLLVNAEATRRSLTEGLERIAKVARPNDHLIIFFAGHGDLLDGDLFPAEAIAPGARGLDRKLGEFVFCLPNYSPAKPKETALTAVELFDALAGINCRKTILFDACHSGRATDANLIRRLIPNGQGPVVIAACDQSEFSYEHPDPKVGHGIFTRVLLDALTKDYSKADHAPDGNLTTAELFRYLSIKVPEAAALIRNGGHPDADLLPQETADGDVRT